MPLQRCACERDRFGGRRRRHGDGRYPHRVRLVGVERRGVDHDRAQRRDESVGHRRAARCPKHRGDRPHRNGHHRSTDGHRSAGRGDNDAGSSARPHSNACATARTGSCAIARTCSHAVSAAAPLVFVHHLADERQRWRRRLDRNDPRHRRLGMRVDGQRDQQLAVDHIGCLRLREWIGHLPRRRQHRLREDGDDHRRRQDLHREPGGSAAARVHILHFTFVAECRRGRRLRIDRRHRFRE